MTIRALAISESVSHRSVAASQALFAVTRRALDFGVNTLERVVRQLFVVERPDLEGISDVACVTLSLGRSETKLPCVNVAVATSALTWRSTVRRPFAAQPILFRRTMATIADRFGVSAGQRPSVVIDPRRLPTSLGVAMGAAAVTHLDGKLIAMGAVVAVDATLCSDVQVVAGPFALVTARATDRLMLANQRELGATVLLYAEQCRPKPVLIMAGPAIGSSEAASMDVAMTVGALLKLQAPIPPLHGELGRMATFARDLTVRAFEGKCRLRMRAQSDFLRQPRPANAGMAVLTSVSKLRFVHLGMTSHALRAHAGRRNVALVVAGLALRLGMARREAQTGMVSSDVGDLAPIGFVVARSAFLPCKSSLMGIFVTGHTLGLQSEKRSVATPIAAIVTVGASSRLVSTLEWPP